MTWEYRVIHINLEAGSPPEPPTPQRDSERLGGSLSPQFLAQEFPQQYAEGQSRPRHPAEQLQFFLNALGKDNWELCETSQLGPLLMLIFKRPAPDPQNPGPPVS